jgi:hypothetical protein
LGWQHPFSRLGKNPVVAHPSPRGGGMLLSQHSQRKLLIPQAYVSQTSRSPSDPSLIEKKTLAANIRSDTVAAESRIMEGRSVYSRVLYPSGKTAKASERSALKEPSGALPKKEESWATYRRSH